jgi:hypothetical protein
MVLRIPLALQPFHLQAFHLLWTGFPARSIKASGAKCGPPTPRAEARGLGYSAFARRYSQNLG